MAGTPSSAVSTKRSRFSSNTASVTAYNKRYAKGFRKTGTLLQQVRSLQKAVASLRPELKLTDISISLVNVTTAGSVTHITGIAQGDDTNGRTGNSISVKNIGLKGIIDEASMTNTGYYRYAFVVDKQQIADTSPGVADIFTGNPLTLFPTAASRDRFTILYLSPIISGTAAKSGNRLQAGYVQYDWSGNINVAYNGTATSDIQKNGIYFVFLSSDASNTVDFTATCRLQYTDEE